MEASIVVPCFERNEVLSLVLESLLNQSYPGEYELIVCDDGSCRPVIDSLLNQHSIPDRVHISYVWQQRRGARVSRSRNNGIRLARGHLLVFNDADVVADRNMLAGHLARHSTERRLVVAGTRLWYRPTKQEESRVCAMGLSHFLEQATYRAQESERRHQYKEARSRNPWRCLRSFNFSVKRTECVSFDEEFSGWFGEDWELAFRLWRNHHYAFEMLPLRNYHIDCGDRTKRIEELARVTSHADIVCCLRSVFYFQGLYPNYNTGVLPFCIYFRLDEETLTWRMADQLEASSMGPAAAVIRAYKWLNARGILPLNALALWDVLPQMAEANPLSAGALDAIVA